jgi:hypothetical protein
MHDWTKVSSGIYHDFHNAWITELRNALNDGLLPEQYYALGEQRAGEFGPDVLTLQSTNRDRDESGNGRVSFGPGGDVSGMIALADAPPRSSVVQEAADEMDYYLSRQRRVEIHHISGDRIVALIELVSPANKRSQRDFDDFVDKVFAAFNEKIHVLIVDPFPSNVYNSFGIHSAIWARLTGTRFSPPADKPLTLVSYLARAVKKAFVEPLTVGDSLIDMPLFLTPDHYVNVPLEITYQRAWSGVPRRWRDVITSLIS